jgi:hypothetical protein
MVRLEAKSEEKRQEATEQPFSPFQISKIHCQSPSAGSLARSEMSAKGEEGEFGESGRRLEIDRKTRESAQGHGRDATER